MKKSNSRSWLALARRKDQGLKFNAVVFGGLMQKSNVYVVGMVLGVVGLMMTGGCSAKKGEVLAEVGHQQITTDDFQTALGNLPENYRVLAESYKGKRKILDNLVKKDLLVEEALRRGYDKQKDIKEKIEKTREESKQKLLSQIKELKVRLAMVDQQAQENVLLGELNQKLKDQGIQGITIGEDQIKAYYQDYARKLKILNPAAKVPDLEDVEKQIKAILVEEELIKQLKKQSKVVVKEERFKTLYGDKEQIVVDH